MRCFQRELWGIVIGIAFGVAASTAVALGTESDTGLDLLLGTEGLWEMTDSEFAEQHIKKGAFGSFEWVSSAKSSARLPHLRHWKVRTGEGGSRSLTPTIGQGKHEVGEVIVRFKQNKVYRVELSIFNRGDDGKSTKENFLVQLREITAFVDKQMEGVRREERPASGKGATHGLLWRGKQNFWLLEYSYLEAARGQGFRPEFIILKIAPAPSSGQLATATGKIKTRSDMRNEVVREKNGDILIKTVPMVDQGQKGYCAVASAERVMRYYGVDVNQHEMAQISNTTRGGTSGKAMTNALKAAAGNYHTRVLTLFEFESLKEMEQVTKTYNRLAKKAKKKQFDIKKYWFGIDHVLTAGDPQLLKEARASGTKYERFKSSVYRYIDDGVPILWALYLGVFKEEGLPQSGGGHMRLIIGYNKKDETLLYTDSWGAGHELKKMPMDEAYTMTMQLTVLQPAH